MVFLAALVLYLPITGHTLQTDDFSRISDNAALSGDYFRDLLLDNKTDGFYRPLNHLSFGLTYHFFGLNPYPYGLFNLLLLLGSSYLVFRIAEEVLSDARLAWLLAVGWLADVKVVSSVVLWGVGRTSGMEVFFMLLAVFAVLPARTWSLALRYSVACVAMALALLSKEGALVGSLFVVAAAIHGMRRTGRARAGPIAVLVLLLAAVTAGYLYLRHASLAMGVESAPAYYRWDLSPVSLLDNLRSYTTRSLAYSGLLIPFLWIVLPPGRQQEPLEPRRRALGAALWITGFVLASAPMLPIPVRSNLYAYFPSLFVVGCVVWLWGTSARWPRRGEADGRLLLVAVLVVALTAPVAWTRGFRNYSQHRHTLDWTHELVRSLEGKAVDTIAILYDPRDLAERGLSERDVEFLETALRLAGVPVDVVGNPEQADPDWPRFRLQREGSRTNLIRIPPEGGTGGFSVDSSPVLR
jgi:hypothetical protein